MISNKNNDATFIAQIAELGEILFWKYNCATQELVLSEQIISFFKDTNTPVIRGEQSYYLLRYLNCVFPEDRDALESVVYGHTTRETGTLDYSLRLNHTTKCHHCKYKIYTENDNKMVIGVITDKTSIRQEEERNAKIIEALPDFLFIFDEDFFIRDLLKSDEVALLHPVEQLIGSDGRDIFSPEVSDIYIKAIRKCLNGQGLQEIEYYLDVDNTRYYFQARMVQFVGNQVMALIHDIGDRVRRTQELIQAKRLAEEADKMKTAFLANMSHEIRTPLNAIVGFSELLAYTDTLEEKESYLDVIKSNSNILLQLINDILDLSRIESGKTEVRLRDTELNNLIEEVARIHNLKMKPDVALKVEHPTHPVWIPTDQNRVSQVLFNFMSNAIKNTDRGTITLSLAITGTTLRLSVSDTGRGIPEDKRQAIFERFTKLNDFVQGTGLGLAICQTIATKLRGKIEVESEYGKGSTFTLVLPYSPTKPTE